MSTTNPIGSFLGLAEQVALAEEFGLLTPDQSDDLKEERALAKADRDWRKMHKPRHGDGVLRTARRISMDGTPDDPHEKTGFRLAGDLTASSGTPAPRTRLNWEEFCNKHAALIASYREIPRPENCVQDLLAAMNADIFEVEVPEEQRSDSIALIVHELLHNERIPLDVFFDALTFIYRRNVENRHLAADPVTRFHTENLAEIGAVSIFLSWTILRSCSTWPKEIGDGFEFRLKDLVERLNETQTALSTLRPERRDFVVALLVEHMFDDEHLTPQEKADAYVVVQMVINSRQQNDLGRRLTSLARKFLQTVTRDERILDGDLWVIANTIWNAGGIYPGEHQVIRDGIVIFDPNLPNVKGSRAQPWTTATQRGAAALRIIVERKMPMPVGHFGMPTTEIVVYADSDDPLDTILTTRGLDLQSALLIRLALMIQQGQVTNLQQFLASSDATKALQDILIERRGQLPILVRPTYQGGNLWVVQLLRYKIQQFSANGKIVTLEAWDNPGIIRSIAVEDALFFNADALPISSFPGITSIRDVTVGNSEFDNVPNGDLENAFRSLAWGNVWP